MAFESFTITKEEGRGKHAKTRGFETRLLGFLVADELWERPRSGCSYPVFLAYFGSDQEAKAFTANFRGGQRAGTDRHTFEIPRQRGFRWLQQRVPDGVITTVYLSQLFDLEPASPFVEDLRLVFAPPRWWVEAQAEALRDDFGDEAREAARAALFAAFLDRRTGVPLLSDLRFHLRLYRAALDEAWIYPLREDYGALLRGNGADLCGLDAPFACSVEAETFTRFLIDQTQLYLDEENPYGPSPSATTGWLLPGPPAMAAQLCFDFAVA